ncbi:MarR family winged helix-turn-helix transcriptional regulator [uncultured Enterovirga sp.]|uniref:MarR family winged helix-turn-helix transcriptional regulator n=1 Tax=uncultured Enterovirga sp. TaxID=2026352 RepID=UPI0035C948F3
MSEAFGPVAAPVSAARETAPAYDLIELFFFAYRDFVGDPDRVLGEFGLGRAHHRVLHFVARRPGLPVADLLHVLQITKQSLNRVLKELIDRDYVEQRAGTLDRRQRLLFPTEAGRDLAAHLARLQTRRIRRALSEDPDGEIEDAARLFLSAMIDPANRAEMRELVGDANRGG